MSIDVISVKDFPQRMFSRPFCQVTIMGLLTALVTSAQLFGASSTNGQTHPREKLDTLDGIQSPLGKTGQPALILAQNGQSFDLNDPLLNQKFNSFLNQWKKKKKKNLCIKKCGGRKKEGPNTILLFPDGGKIRIPSNASIATDGQLTSNVPNWLQIGMGSLEDGEVAAWMQPKSTANLNRITLKDLAKLFPKKGVEHSDDLGAFKRGIDGCQICDCVWVCN